MEFKQFDWRILKELQSRKWMQISNLVALQLDAPRWAF